MKNNFIKTSDEETARRLAKLGFQEVMSSEVDMHVFVNEKTLHFDEDEIDRSKLVYCNTLCF